MKKNILKLFLFIFTLIQTSCGISTSDITEIEIINTANNEKNIVSNDSETAKNIVDAINKKEDADENISDLFSYEIHINDNSEIQGYRISFDVVNKKVYLSKDDKVYIVKDRIAEKLLVDENFSYAYIADTIYESHLDYNGQSIEPNVEYNWTFKNIEGHFTQKEGVLVNEDKKINISDSDIVNFKFEKEPDTQVVRVYKEGNVLYTGNTTEVINQITKDGEYLIESQVQWFKKENSQYYGNQTISFLAIIDRKPDFTIISRENYPGNILSISVENLNEDDTVKISTTAIKNEIEVYPNGDNYISIAPIDLNTVPGDYEITAVFNEDTSNEHIITKTFNIGSKVFKTQYLQVTEELNESNNDDAAIIEFAQLVKPARSESLTEKLWEGPFIMPIEGELTTDFAEIRYVNNEPSSSRHSGIDLAAPVGTEVKAPNNGVVTFAMIGLLSPGNTVVIDHGLGLFTSYYHLDSILVKVGEHVSKGDVIGTVGSTGFSTGPHLHYAVSIYNTYVNTYQPLTGIIN